MSKVFFCDKGEGVTNYLRDKWTPMVLLHVRDLTTGDVPGYSHWTAAVHDLATAAAVLKRIEMFADLSVISVGVDCLVFIEGRDRTHLLLQHVLLSLKLLVLRVVILMAIDNDRWRSVVLVIVADVDVRPRRSLWVIMMISSAVNGQKSLISARNSPINLQFFKKITRKLLFTNSTCMLHKSTLIWVPKNAKNRAKIIYKWYLKIDEHTKKSD